MELRALDKDLKTLGFIDAYESLLWRDAYRGAGDFELITQPSDELFALLGNAEYFFMEETEHLMTIDSINIQSDPTLGGKLKVTGVSIEYLLSRRIVESQTSISGNLQNGIKQLLDENAISPTNVKRKLSKLVFLASDDPAITSLEMEGQFFGVSLYTAITDLCESKKIGFKLTPTVDGKFQFTLYSGVDRSYEQNSNPYIVFSPGFDNLINGDYTHTSRNLKTVTFIAGEKGVGNVRKVVELDLSDGELSDLERRELFTDASGVTRNISGGGKLTDAEYENQLVQKGLEDLAKNTIETSFEGQVDASGIYRINEDFFMGDILEVADSYGNEARSVVTEVIFSQDPAGYKVYPTFVTVG